MPSMFVARRILVPGGALLAVLAGCGPSPSPVAPPPPTAAPVAPVAPPPAPEPTAKTEEVDYGTPPKAPCVRRAAASPPRAPRSLAERKAQKYDLARETLKTGPLYVELDGRKPGVALPPVYKNVGRVVLVIGYDLPQPIPDLAVDAEGVSGRLLFKMKQFPVRVPWDAVYGLMNDDEDVSRWLEDIPADVLCPDSEPSDPGE